MIQLKPSCSHPGTQIQKYKTGTYVSKMGNTNIDHGRNSQLNGYTYDILLLETIHFNTISMNGYFKLLSVAALLFKNSWLV